MDAARPIARTTEIARARTNDKGPIKNHLGLRDYRRVARRRGRRFVRLELSPYQGQVVSSRGRTTVQMSDHFGHASSRVSAAPLLTIDPSSREPLQQQIYRGLRRAILDGV